MLCIMNVKTFGQVKTTHTSQLMDTDYIGTMHMTNTQHGDAREIGKLEKLWWKLIMLPMKYCTSTITITMTLLKKQV